MPGGLEIHGKPANFRVKPLRRVPADSDLFGEIFEMPRLQLKCLDWQHYHNPGGGRVHKSSDKVK